MFRDLRPYESYRGSGTPWLPAVPTHWRSPRLKAVLAEKNVRGFAEEPLLAATQSRGVIRKADYGSRTVTAQKDLDLLKLVEVGDFVISLRSFQGGIERAHARGIISPAYTILEAREPADADFLTLLFKSRPFVEALTLTVTGIREGQSIEYPRLARDVVPVPSRDEQAAIVKYLTHAHHRIDRAIAAKRKLIALLDEQKQAIINQAVTRGLDPSVPLKDTDIPWLGLVPAHWEVAALRHRYSQVLGKMLDSSRITGEHSLPYLRNVDVQWDRVNTENLPYMDIPETEYERYTVTSGDLLVCEGGEVGRSAIWDGSGRVAFQKALHRLRPTDERRDYPRYLLYAMRTAASRAAFSDGHVSTIAHLTGEKLRAHRFAWPPAEEQFGIVAQIETETDTADAAIERARREIDLLREFRARLTSDVVTGQVDVRHIAAALPDLDTENLTPDVGSTEDDLVDEAAESLEDVDA